MEGDNGDDATVLRTTLVRYHGVMNCDYTVMIRQCYGQHCSDTYHIVMNGNNTVMMPW